MRKVDCRTLEIGLMVADDGTMEINVKDPESGLWKNLVFNRSDAKEEIVQSIGEEIYDWIIWMFGVFDEE